MRTFIAFTLPDDVANQIVEWQQANLPPNVYPEPATNLHMTLAFLGDTPDELVPQINAILQQLDPRQVSIDGAIEYREKEKLAFLVFNEQGGTDIWEELNRQLYELTGYTPQFTPWLPHTTVWRYSAENKPNISPPLPVISFSPTAVTLYQSVKNPAGGGTFLKVGNILDPIQGNLDPRVFRGTEPRPAVANFIKRLYYRTFAHEFGIPIEHVPQYVNLVLTGSLTTYQWSDTSDCDISVFINWKNLQDQLGLDPKETRRDLIAMGIDKLDGTFLPGGSHPLQFFVISEGIEPQDLYQPGLRSGYDLGARQWLVEPEKSRVHDIALEFPDVYQRASEIGEKMRIMLDTDQPEMAKELWKQVHMKRMLDQQAGLGDFCEGNVVYKWLVHEGLVDRLRKELRLQISTKVAVDWGGNLDPAALDAELEVGGMSVWNKLQEQIERLAVEIGVDIHYLPRNMLWFSRLNTEYDTSLGDIKWSFIAEFPEITGEQSYWVALHELGHAAFRRQYGGRDLLKMVGSLEEELWAHHWALEHAQIAFNPETAEMMQKAWQSHEHVLPPKSKMAPDWTISKTAATMKIIYDFEKDRIILGSEAAAGKTVMIGEYDEEAKSATLYEAEQNWINGTYFRRLWNYSYPHRPLKEVHYQRGENKRKLKTQDHPHHERHVSATQIMYHVAPIDRRDSIFASGLQPGHARNWEESSNGIYLFDDPNIARDWPYEMRGLADQYGNDVRFDIWQVDTTGLPLQPDTDSVLGGRAWLTPSVDPEKLNLVVQDATKSRGPHEDTIWMNPSGWQREWNVDTNS
jgi:2'-5' RNA ligase